MGTTATFLGRFQPFDGGHYRTVERTGAGEPWRDLVRTAARVE